MEDLQRWEYILQEAHAKAEANPDDTEARDDAQYAADQIRSILSANQSSATPEQTNGQGVSQVITQPIAGVATALGLGGVKGIGHLQNKRDLNMARAFVKAQQEINAKAPSTGRTGIERQLQGTIDPETGETGRARQTGYNELTHEQKVARAQNKPIIQSLIQSGQITGTNPILGATGYTGSTETGVLAKPEDIAAYKASKAVPTAPQVKPPSMLSNALSTTGNVAGKVLNKISPYAAAYGLGSQAFDTAERGWQGDYPGAVISALGAASNFGGIPGIATGLALEKMNRMRDEFARGERQLPDHEKTDPMGGNYAGGGAVHLAGGGKLGMLKELADLIKSPERTPVVPASSEWFKGNKGPQPLIEKVLQKTGKERSDYPYGAFVDPRTGEVLDQNIYGSTGVLIDPLSGRPMMSVKDQLESLMPKNGLQTKSNLLKNNKYNVLGGDSMLEKAPFVATIDSGPGHFYGMGTEYATPTQLKNLEGKASSNPYLRPVSHGDLFGMGDIIGQIKTHGGLPKDVYEKLFVAPKGSDVPGVRLNRATGGPVHMAGGRQPSVSLEELDTTPAETGAAFGKFPQMNPKRAQPQGGALHGYLDGFLGAPKNENMSVIIPQEMAYLKAYDKAEPYGMAANMVSPIASLGKTVGTPLVKALGQHAVDKVFSGEPLIKGMDFLNPQVLGAVKFKGGNTPLGLGSTLPLEKQGDMGRFLNQSQITDPLKMFETNLKTHYDPNQFDRRNLKLNEEFKNYWEDRKSAISGEMSEAAFINPNSPEMLKAKKEAAENFALRHNNLSALGFEEGNKRLYPPSSIESIMPHYNNWVNGPLKSHITKTMGTGIETDPMLKLMNESAIEPKELFGNHYSMVDDAVDVAKNADRRREKFTKEFSGGYKSTPELEEQVKNSSVGKQTATTPIGKYYEDLIDARLYPRGTYSFNSTDFPGTKHIKNNEVISDFMGLPDDSLGFGAISKKVIDGLLSGEIPLNKLTSQTPANVLQSIIKEKTDAMKALQKDDNAYQSWRQVNNDALPAETRFTDVDGNPTNKKLVIFDSKMANENPDLLVRNLSQETRDLNHCGGSCGRDNDKYVPMVNPHTGVANKGAGDYGKNYVERIKDGRISIASLRGANGESKATLELSNDGKLRVSQLKGHSDGVVDPETANDLKNWLNHKSSTKELSERSISDLKNLRDVSDSNDVSNTIGKMVERNKEWNPATVENLLSANKSEMPRFFTDKEFEALAKKKGIDLTKDEALNLSNLSPRELDYTDYFKPGSVRKSYSGHDQILAYDPRTGKVKVQAVVKNPDGNWVPHPDYYERQIRTHSTHPDSKEFQREMGRPFRRDPEFDNPQGWEAAN
jgi:hypothetical protein